MLSWFLQFISYFQYHHELNSDFIQIYELEGYHSTYQVFDFTFEGNGAFILQQAENHVMIGDVVNGKPIKFDINHGVGAESEIPRLILIGDIQEHVRLSGHKIRLSFTKLVLLFTHLISEIPVFIVRIFRNVGYLTKENFDKCQFRCC